MSTHVPGFQSIFRFLHHFVLAKLATSSIGVKTLIAAPLTCTGLVVGVERVVRRAGAGVWRPLAGRGIGQTQVGAATITKEARVVPVLPRHVKDQDVHDVVQVALDARAVRAADLIGSLDAPRLPVCPIDVVLVLRQTERVWQGTGDDSPPTTTWK